MTHAYAALPVPGSRRRPLAGTRRVGDADPQSTAFVTVVLRRGGDGPGTAADQADIDQVWLFASRFGLEVVAVSRPARSVRLRGTVADMNIAFGVDLGTYEGTHRTAGEVSYRGRVGSVYIPEALDGVVVAVLGLDNRPQAHTHFRVAPGARPGAVAPHAVASGSTPREIAAGYGFPTDVDGAGQTVGIVELGGGYRAADLHTYFADLGVPAPVVESVNVDGASNAPGDDADGEVMLDVEVVGAVAPGARIAVYFGPNTSDGFYDAIAAAVHDDVRRPSVISISWGQAEDGWNASQLDVYDALFADAAAHGITVYAAAGDNGATDGDTDGANHVDFPASSPSVVGCGGTTLTADGETVWNELATDEGATGGGYSTHFATPGYQLAIGVSGDGRGVPDVAGNADPLTGYRVRVDGQDLVIGGTSAVAPLWSALTALANQRLAGAPGATDGGPGSGAAAAGTDPAAGGGAPATVGAPHARMYAAPGAFRDIVTGDNGGFSAGPGWDACTGLGSPAGEASLAALAGTDPAGSDPAGG
jgi:kumamolisin